MRNIILLSLVLITSSNLNAQTFNNYKELKAICEASLVDSKKMLEIKGFGNGTIFIGESWGMGYVNKSDSTEKVFILIDPKEIVYQTTNRSSFLSIIESATSSKLMKEVSSAEKRDLKLSQYESIFRSEGGFFAYSQQKDTETNKFVYTIMWISTNTVNSEVKVRSEGSYTEPAKKKQKDNYAEIQKDIANREPLNYVLWSAGGWLASEQFQASTGSSTNLQSVYTSGKKFGGDVLGFHLGIGGIYSPWGLNRKFRSNFDISFRYGVSYCGIGFDLSFKDPSAYDYSTTWFGNVAGGFGPALSFSSSDNDYAISFYYLPQLNYNFGGKVNSPSASSSNELMERNSGRLGYRGSLGVDIKLSSFYLGFEYGKYKDKTVWNYTNVVTTSPVSIKSKLEMSQIIFKIGFTIND